LLKPFVRGVADTCTRDENAIPYQHRIATPAIFHGNVPNILPVDTPNSEVDVLKRRIQELETQVQHGVAGMRGSNPDHGTTSLLSTGK
jgi:hypothetical protein